MGHSFVVCLTGKSYIEVIGHIHMTSIALGNPMELQSLLQMAHLGPFPTIV